MTVKTKNAKPQTGKELSIKAGRMYPLAEFMELTGLGKHAMRTARRNGLFVRYIGGRGFVHADDFIAYSQAHSEVKAG